MRFLQICYDLKGLESRLDYERLIQKLKTLGTAERAQYSVWFLKTSLTYTQVRDILTQCVDSKDSLVITEVTAMATYNVPNSVVNLADQTWYPTPITPLLPTKTLFPINKLGKSNTTFVHLTKL